MSCSSGPDITTNGLILRLDAFDIKSYPKSGTTWFDRSGNGNHGTFVNGVVYSNGDGGSILFDGVDDYIKIPYSSLLLPSNITVSAWINRLQVVNYSHFIGLPISNTLWNSPYMSYGVEYISNSNTISFPLGFTDNTYAYTNATAYGNNQWFYFVATYDKSNVKIYIDSVLQATRAETKTLYNSTADFYIGAINTSALFPLNGKISNVSIYNRALSPQEIKQNFNSTKGRYRI